MEIKGWSNASFDDSSWNPVQNSDEFKGNPKYKGLYKLSWQPMTPIRAIELMKPLSITPIRLLYNQQKEVITTAQAQPTSPQHVFLCSES